MQVNNNVSGPVRVDHLRREQAEPERGAANVHHASSHIRSEELQRLIDGVKELPEVRNDVLARVSERLKTGFYFTPQAADQVAQAILRTENGG
ncbi:MAG: hypothetical protein KatS3mg105_0766 [Gemmatales bacterium]|nr:MAG: hypothetical protein KatS3mg105_0766 [Gemmatales bacterium]